MASKSPVSPGLIAVLFCALGGCGSLQASPTTPAATIREFSVALNQNDPERAYKLMSEEYRQKTSLAQFRQQLEGNPEEAIELSFALSHIGEKAPRDTTLYYYGEGRSLRLVREGRSWRIATDLVNFYDQSTPREALRSFLRAMEARRYDVVMRFIPTDRKEGVTPEQFEEDRTGKNREAIERDLRNLRNNADNPIEVTGNRATMPYGERLNVLFLLENGAWKIEDFM